LSVPGLVKITINGVDVSSYLYRGKYSKTASQPIKNGMFIFSKNINTVLTIDDSIIGKSITVQRGVSVSTERYILRGEVVSYVSKGSTYEFSVSDKLYAAQRLEYNYTYDINTDSQLGVGSEIVKNLITQAGLSYTTSSVISTGTTTNLLLRKYQAKNKIIDSLKDLAKTYKYQIFYKDSDDLVYFIPVGYTATSTVLTTGVDITERIPWKTTGEDIANNITLIGGEQLDWAAESFAGPNTTFTLVAKPVDTDVTVGGVKKQRGVNSSDPKDFYVDSEKKQLIFTTSSTGIVVNYSYNVPVKVNSTDYASVTKFLQRDQTVIDSRLTNTDDATLKINNLLEDSSDSLTTAPINVVGNNDLEVGQQVQIVDSVQGITKDVVVQNIDYTFPYKADMVTVGAIPVTPIDTQISVIDAINKLQAQLSSDTDINIQIINTSSDLAVLGYSKLETAPMDANALYWDSDTQGEWSNDAGSNGYNWGTDTAETYTVDSLIPLNNSYLEDFYSSEFKDAGNTTATWGTTGSLVFTGAQTAQSSYYLKDLNTSVSKITLTATSTGSLSFYVSADGSNFEIVSSGVLHNMTSTGNYMYWRAVSTTSATATKIILQVT
jgi:hypothetical protein